MSPEFGQPLVYRLDPARRRFLWLVWALFTLPLLAGGVYADDTAAIVTGILAGVILGLVFGIAAWRQPRLELTPRGITLHQLGYRLEATWPMVAALRLVPGSEGLILRGPMRGSQAGRIAGLAGLLGGTPTPFRLYPPEVLEHIAAKRYIPMDAFSHALRRGDLGRQIVEHAPWLAPEGKTPPPATVSKPTP